MPFTILAPVIFVLCVVGGYAPTQDLHDVWLMMLFGIVGYLMRKLEYPLAPAVLAIVLGPLAEPALRQSLLISNGSFSVFFEFDFEKGYSGPISLVAFIMFALPLIKLFRDRSRRKASGRA